MEILDGLKEYPTALAALLGERDSFDQNPFMNAVFHRKRDPATGVFRFKHALAIELLEAIPDLAQRRSIVMQVSSFGANVLHIAASRGNLEFLQAFQVKWSEWGLSVVDVTGLILAIDTHNATPLEMALFQQTVRGRDRSAVLYVLNQLLKAMLQQLDVMSQISFP